MDEKKIFIFLLFVHLLFFRGGWFTDDEGAYYLLTRSISEDFPNFIDLSKYLKHTPGSGPYYSFFYYKNEIHAGIAAGFPLFASPFYTLFGRIGINIFNLIANLLISYIIFLIVSQRYDKKYGVLASIFYVFITPSLFYASSLWHHTSVTFFFILSQYQFLKLKDRKKDILLFSLFSSLTVLSSYYMIVPLGLLYAYILIRLSPKLKLLGFSSFALFLLPTFIYNYINFGSPFLGEYGVPKIVSSVVEGEGSSFAQEIKKLFSSLMVLLISIDISKHYYAFVQKSLLQSSPILAFGLLLPFFRVTPRFTMLFFSNMLLILIVAYADGDFGGWELNMRYLMPVFPFLIISLSSLLYWLKIDFKIEFICFLFLLEAILLLLYPIGIFSEPYLLIKILASFFGLTLLFAGLMFNRVRKELVKTILFILIIFSAFINLNDASYGASYRSAYTNIEESLDLQKERVIFPKEIITSELIIPENLFLPENEVILYNNTNLNNTLKGELILMLRKSHNIQGCNVEEVRTFENFYYYLVREENLKKRMKELKENYEILKLNCGS